jgi:hypothetical protein
MMTNALSEKLPPHCYAKHPVTGEVIYIRRGVKGYWQLKQGDTVEQRNARLDPVPTRQQIEAMSWGSCFGWDLPCADPDNYDEQGNVK